MTNRWIVMVGTLSVVISTAARGQTQPRPDDAFDILPSPLPAVRADPGTYLPFRMPRFELTFTEQVPSNAPDYYAELYYVLHNLNVQTPSGLRMMNCETTPSLHPGGTPNSQIIQIRANGDRRVERLPVTKEEVAETWRLTDSEANELADALQAKLNSFSKPFSNLTAEERTEKLKRIDSAIAETNQKLQAIQVLRSVQINPSVLLAERMKQLRQDLQQLEMEKAAKLARQKALMVGMAEQSQRAAKQKDEDARLKYYLAAAQVQAAKVERMTKAAAAFSDAERTQAQAELLQAQTQVQIRVDELSRTAKGDLLDRLSDELAMVSVDLTDIELRLDDVHAKVTQYDLSKMTDSGLQQLIAQEPFLSPRNDKDQAPLSLELLNVLPTLYQEHFGLIAKDLQVRALPASPEPSAAGRPLPTSRRAN